MCKETRVSPEIVSINHFSIQFKRHRMLLLLDMGGVRRGAKSRGGGQGRRHRLPDVDALFNFFLNNFGRYFLITLFIGIIM